MTYICGKWLQYVRNGKKYVGNGVDMWKIAKICWEMA